MWKKNDSFFEKDLSIEHLTTSAILRVLHLAEILIPGSRTTRINESVRLCVSEKEMGNEKVQERLDQTAGLIGDLQRTQKERLSQKPPPHLALVTGPSDKEVELGE